MEKLVILGSGIAGLTAALYAARANLDPIVISGYEEGGQLMLTTVVENYPGFPDGVMGPELIQKMKDQAKKFGAKFKSAEAKGFNVQKDHVEIVTSEETIKTTMLIITTGASARWLDIPSEKQFMGKGVHTCATCDGYFYQDKELIIVGGGDSACEESTFFFLFAKKVTIVHRRDEMRASKIMQERIKKNPKIKFIWNTVIEELKGDTTVKGVILKDVNTGKTKEMKIDGIFLAIGHIPNTTIFKGKIDMDDHGFIKTDRKLLTNVPGVFAAGDVQDPRYKQAVTAAGTGCQAAMEAERYYESWKEQHEKK